MSEINRTSQTHVRTAMIMKSLHPTVGSYYSDGDRLHFRRNKQHAVKINTEDKHRETPMFVLFLKRELRTDNAQPMHRISKAISENKHGGETEGNVHV